MFLPRGRSEKMIVLVLGGTRSGKSEFAEQLVSQLPSPATYLATATSVDDDPTFLQRIAAHRRRRPAAWATIETGAGLAAALSRSTGTVLVDSLGTWLAAHWDFAADEAALCNALTGRVGDTVIVSEEVGLGVHAPTELGRRFADRLGEVNQAVGSISDRVLLVVAGRALDLRPPSELSPPL